MGIKLWALLVLSTFSGPTFANYNVNQGAVNNAAPTATVEAGVLVGKTTTLPTALGPVNQFLGVPFAQSPPQRFSPPQPASRSSKPIDATAWKPACIQQFRCMSCTIPLLTIALTTSDPLASNQFTQAVFNNPRPVESEDCLYLNVYAPATPAGGAGRAVMVWIYGGSLQFGNAGT